MLLAYLGDSDAMLCRDGEPICLTRHHRPADAQEQARVEAAGGWIVGRGEARRVNGVLGVTRSLGDIEYKLWKDRAWGQAFTADLVSAAPSLLRVALLPRRDEFVVIGTDGLWDVLSMAEVAAEARAWREAKGSLDGVASRLAKEAIARGSDDNVTLVVLGLEWD